MVCCTDVRRHDARTKKNKNKNKKKLKINLCKNMLVKCLEISQHTQQVLIFVENTLTISSWVNACLHCFGWVD